MKINGLILAAGMSRRMGEFKPLLKINLKTVIEQSIDSMISAGVDEIIVVLGYRGEEIEELLRLNGNYNNVRLAYNKHYDNTEMIDSIKIGLSTIGKCDAFFLLPGDMPAVSKDTFLRLKRIMENYRGEPKIVFPSIDGKRKHPPLISSKYIEDILNFKSKGGLSKMWGEYEDNIILVSVNDIGCSIDLDTKEQYEEICNYMKNKS